MGWAFLAYTQGMGYPARKLEEDRPPVDETLASAIREAAMAQQGYWDHRRLMQLRKFLKHTRADVVAKYNGSLASYAEKRRVVLDGIELPDVDSLAISERTYARWEAGQFCPSVWQWEAMLYCLGVSAEFFRTEPKEKGKRGR
jgi:hypothetical protein